MLVGGGRKDGPGWFVEPTVLVDTEASMQVRKEEIFGPVLCATRFSSRGRCRPAGRARQRDRVRPQRHDLDQGHRHGPPPRPPAHGSGSVRINGAGGVDPALPLGGYKASGWGRENGKAGIEAYTELKAVSVALD